MKLSRSLLRPSFFRRRNAAFRRSPFFSRKRGAAAADNPEPSSPKVTCIGQVRVQSQKKVKQCRRRIGEASFRSTDQQPPPPPRWVHLPNITLLLRAFGHELCCWFRCRCCCGATREREKEKEREREREREIKYADENGCGALLGRWLVAEGGRRREIEVVVGGGGGDEEIMSAGNSRRHVFDDIEVKGDRIEVKGRSGEGETTRFSICIPPKNALLLMRCRSDPLKMAAIANRISSDAAKYGYGGIEEKQEEEEESYDESTSSEEFLEGEHKVYVAQVLEKREMRNVEDCGEKLVIINEKKVEEIEQELNEEEEEEKEETESNMSSFEALLDQENTEQDQNFAEVEEAKSDVDKASAHIEPNEDATIVQEEQNALQPDKLEPEMPEHQETATKKETAAAAALPECLLLMMREPKLSMEVSKETWVCATDFIRLLPERPRRAAAKAAATGGGGGDHHEPVVKRRSAVEKSRPRVPAPPGKRNDVQPARSSCSLPAASTAAVIERKRANGGAACEPLALTRCKSEPMSTAAAKLLPEPGCWKDNVEPHRQASVGVGAAGVGF